MKKKEKKKASKRFAPVYMTIWEDAFKAITSPKQYLRWALQPISRSFQYLALINLVLTIVTTIFFASIIRPEALLLADLIEKEIPSFTISEEGILQIEQDQAFGFSDSDSFFFKIDPTISVEDEPFIDNFYEQGLLITSDQIIMQSLNQDPEVTNISELGLPQISGSGSGIASWIRTYSLGLVLIILPPLLFLYYMVAKSLYSLFFAVMLYIGSGFKHNLMRFWSMGIYALTPAIIAGHIAFVTTPISGLYTAVFVFYLFSAYLHYLRFLNKHTNLLKKK